MVRYTWIKIFLPRLSVAYLQSRSLVANGGIHIPDIKVSVHQAQGLRPIFNIYTLTLPPPSLPQGWENPGFFLTQPSFFWVLWFFRGSFSNVNLLIVNIIDSRHHFRKKRLKNRKIREKNEETLIFLFFLTETISRTEDVQPRPKYIFN